MLENAATYFESKHRFDELQLEDVLRWCDDARARIRAERLKLKMSQAELGFRVGISRVSICEFEAGRGSLSDQTIERMLDTLDIDRVERAQRNLERHAAGTAQAIEDLRGLVSQ